VTNGQPGDLLTRPENGFSLGRDVVTQPACVIAADSPPWSMTCIDADEVAGGTGAAHSTKRTWRHRRNTQ
jgi:hypothetical protein